MSVDLVEAGLALGHHYRYTYLGQQRSLFGGEDAMFTIQGGPLTVDLSEAQLTRLRQQWPGRFHSQTPTTQTLSLFPAARPDSEPDSGGCQSCGAMPDETGVTLCVCREACVHVFSKQSGSCLRCDMPEEGLALEAVGFCWCCGQPEGLCVCLGEGEARA